MDNRNNQPQRRNTNKNPTKKPQQHRNSGSTANGSSSNATTLVAVLIVIAVFVNYNIFSKIITKTVPASDYSKYGQSQSNQDQKDPEQAKKEAKLLDISQNYTDIFASFGDTKRGELILVNSLCKFDFEAKSTLVTNEQPESIYDSKSDCYYVKNVNVALNKSAIMALNSLLEAFKEATGHSDIIIVDGHRTYEMQKIVLDAKIDQYGEEQGRRIATEPGASEHHTGYALDLSLFINGRQEEYFGQGVYDWITKNCYKYGFVIRYAQDKTDITGIDYEPWHLRYVGIPHAYYMTLSNLSLEEYADRLSYYPIESDRLTISAPNGTYEVYSCPVSENGGQIKVPKDKEYTLSGNNKGYVVVTTKLADTQNVDLVQQKYQQATSENTENAQNALNTENE